MKWKKQNRINLSPGEDDDEDDLEIQEGLKDSESLSEEEDEAYSSSSDPASGQKMQLGQNKTAEEKIPVVGTSTSASGITMPAMIKPMLKNENPYKA